MEQFNSVLEIINIVLSALVGVAFGFQFIYLLLFWLPKRKYKEAEEKHYVGVFITARNESEVLGRTIKLLQTKINYPKDKYEIIILADNCDDNTAEIARSLDGEVKVRVFERHEEDPKKRNVGFALKYLFEQLLPTIDNYDFFIRFDADDIVDKEYLNQMNNAYSSGVLAAKGYNNATNITQNLTSGVSALWYLKDSRFNCHSRAGIHTYVHLVGGGMMFAASIIKEDGGWVCTHTSEDTQFTILNMKKKRKCRYVPDAIVYEDQPSSIKALLTRFIRMGHSLNHLFWTEGLKCLGRFFTSFRYWYLDMFLNLIFIPIALLCCTWYPVFYTYMIVYNGVVGNFGVMNTYLTSLWVILVFAYLVPIYLQAFLTIILDRKKIKAPTGRLIGICLIFPFFMIVYAVGIALGVCTHKQKWGKVERNVQTIDKQLQEEIDQINY